MIRDPVIGAGAPASAWNIAGLHTLVEASLIRAVAQVRTALRHHGSAERMGGLQSTALMYADALLVLASLVGEACHASGVDPETVIAMAVSARLTSPRCIQGRAVCASVASDLVRALSQYRPGLAKVGRAARFGTHQPEEPKHEAE